MGGSTVTRWLLAASLGWIAAIPLAAAEPIDFDQQIRPIFERRCYECHGPAKQRAKLRLDSPDAIRSGAGGESVIVPGKPDASTLYQRISLPPDDIEIMPAEGETLTADEISLIRDWIDQGAGFGATASRPAPAAAPRPGHREAFDAPAVPPADPAAIEKFRAAGAWVAPIGGGTNLLGVSLRHRAGLDDPAGVLALLTPLREQIAWLDLAHTDVSDAALAGVSGLKNLRRLNLEKTAVGDGGLAHLQGLVSLGYLNLYGTRVTDGGLQRLNGLENLRQIYLWQTPTTDAGIAALRNARPDLRVFRAATTAPAEASLGVMTPAAPPTPMDP